MHVFHNFVITAGDYSWDYYEWKMLCQYGSNSKWL